MPRRYVRYVHSEELIQEADKNPTVKGRASLTHELIRSYDLLPHMLPLRPLACAPANLRFFHSRSYVRQFDRFVREATAEEEDEDSDYDFDSLSLTVAENYGLGFDCPTWPRLKDYVCRIAGATMSACAALVKTVENENLPEIIVNWTGGWHHAQRHKAAGFCYVNDIVLGILVLRKRFRRILYLDLDVHHGDGVQAAFETTKRVFTLSFHKYECGFYPGSGCVKDCGFGTARGYAANFPYQSGISGANFKKYFHRVTSKILDIYQPDACVVQCGADAMVGDPLGGANLTPADIIECVDVVLKRNLPTVVLGGGGYNFTNASRFWTQLTAAMCGRQLSDDIPVECENFLDYGPDYCLSIAAEKHMKDLNTQEYLESCAVTIEGNLRKYKVFAL